MVINGGFNGYPKKQQNAKPVEEQPKPIQTPAQKEPEYIEYKIKKGDTLTKIAKAYGTTIAKLKEINNIKNVNLIYAGDIIKIPKKK